MVQHTKHKHQNSEQEEEKDKSLHFLGLWFFFCAFVLSANMTDTNNTLKEAILSNNGNGNGNGSSSSRRLLDRKGPSSSVKRGWLESTLSFTRLASFKEDTYVVSELKDSERKALQELKDTMTTMGDDASVWGITLTPRGQGEEDADDDEEERREVVLLKFLRAREFRVAEAMEMVRKCVAWRKSYGADAIVEEKIDLDDGVDLGSVAYMHGTDRDGHPVCYNAYGVFKDRGVYDKIFGDDEKLKKFLRWRVQVLEKGIRLLDFRPGGVNSMIQITDLLNMPKRELREASNQILALFQDNYPELVAKKVFINVPWYFSVLYTMISPFLTQRTKSKFVIASEGKVAETLYKFIPPENIPFQYGGLSRPKDVEFGPQKPAAEFTIRAGEKINLEIEDVEDGSTVVWDLVVGGWNVTYLAEFVPSAKGNYSVLIEKSRMMSPSDEPIFNSFKACEAGKVVLIIDNTLSNRKKVAAYRYMIKRT